jgi:hypothetical protein
MARLAPPPHLGRACGPFRRCPQRSARAGDVSRDRPRRGAKDAPSRITVSPTVAERLRRGDTFRAYAVGARANGKRASSGESPPEAKLDGQGLACGGPTDARGAGRRAARTRAEAPLTVVLIGAFGRVDPAPEARAPRSTPGTERHQGSRVIPLGISQAARKSIEQAGSDRTAWSPCVCTAIRWRQDGGQYSKKLGASARQSPRDGRCDPVGRRARSSTITTAGTEGDVILATPADSCSSDSGARGSDHAAPPVADDDDVEPRR